MTSLNSCTIQNQVICCQLLNYSSFSLNLKCQLQDLSHVIPFIYNGMSPCIALHLQSSLNSLWLYDFIGVHIVWKNVNYILCFYVLSVPWRNHSFQMDAKFSAESWFPLLISRKLKFYLNVWLSMGSEHLIVVWGRMGTRGGRVAHVYLYTKYKWRHGRQTTNCFQLPFFL